MRAAMTTEVERLMQRGFGVIASRTVLAISSLLVWKITKWIPAAAMPETQDDPATGDAGGGRPWPRQPHSRHREVLTTRGPSSRSAARAIEHLVDLPGRDAGDVRSQLQQTAAPTYAPQVRTGWGASN